MKVNSFPNKPTTRAAIYRVFARFYGSGTWAAITLGVSKSTVSKWLRGRKEFPAITPEKMGALAVELLATNGKCIKSPRKGFPK